MSLVDSTLRDGEQAPGVYFALHDKIRICNHLQELGIEEVEIGTPSLSMDEQRDIRVLLKLQFDFKALAWCRAKKSDLQDALDCGCRRVHMAIPISDIQLETVGIKWHEIQDVLAPLLRFAKSHFSFVSVGAQDASRAPFSRLMEFAKYLSEFKVDRMRIADTLGVYTPISLWTILQDLRVSVPQIPIEFHGHNDLGMATANAFVALQQGAAASATVLGIGERAGNASLEQLVMASHYHGLKSHYKTECLKQLCQHVSMASHLKVARYQPIVGENTFKHESGIHVNGMLKDPRSYEPFAPELVGAERPDFTIGKHSGKSSLKEFMMKRNMVIRDDQKLERILRKVKKLSATVGRSLEDHEVMDLMGI